jgi:hypothetical protein
MVITTISPYQDEEECTKKKDRRPIIKKGDLVLVREIKHEISGQKRSTDGHVTDQTSTEGMDETAVWSWETDEASHK